MVKTKFFNFFDTVGVKKVVSLPKSLVEHLDQPVLIDDVDTTITSFLKTYGAPVHIDPDDFEEGDDKDFDEFDDEVDDSVSVEPVEPVKSEPVEPVKSEPVEPVKSEPVEPVKSEPVEPVSE